MRGGRPRRRDAILVALACFCSSSATGRVTTVAQVGSAAQARFAEHLVRYQAGDFDGAVQALVGNRAVRSLVGEFRRGAGAWIDQASAAERSHRAKVVAAFSAELMAATFGQTFPDYLETRNLVDWACDRIRQQPPSETERWFYLTTIALAQGARDDSFLDGVQRPVTESRQAPGPHAAHAGTRFPQEGRFKLAWVTTNWETQFIATFPVPPQYLFRTLYGRFWIETDNSKRVIPKTLEALSVLFGDPGVGPEARLRSGVLKFELGNIPAARTDLQHAETAEDASVRYLAHLMLGTIADQSGDTKEALRRFRLAYEIVPASAASIALASRFYRSGAEEEAAEILRRFEAQQPPLDPWELYGQRDYRFSGAYRAEMRKSLVR